MVKSITVFRNREENSLPNMIFWVGVGPPDPIWPEPAGDEVLGSRAGGEEQDEREKDGGGGEVDKAVYQGPRVMKRSKDGKKVVREHVFRI